MRHAREDYQRIQDPAGLIPEKEPVFLLRASDAAAPAAVIAWADCVQELRDHDPEIVRKARAWAGEMLRWQQTHGSKTPDLPKPAAGGGQ